MQNVLPAAGFARLKQFPSLGIPIPPSTVWAWVRKGKFPAPIKISEGVTAWRLADINAWIEAQPQPIEAAENRGMKLAEARRRKRQSSALEACATSGGSQQC